MILLMEEEELPSLTDNKEVNRALLCATERICLIYGSFKFDYDIIIVDTIAAGTGKTLAVESTV